MTPINHRRGYANIRFRQACASMYADQKCPPPPPSQIFLMAHTKWVQTAKSLTRLPGSTHPVWTETSLLTNMLITHKGQWVNLQAFPPFLLVGKSFVTSSLLLWEKALLKWVLFLKEKICSKGSKFFPLRIDSL